MRPLASAIVLAFGVTAGAAGGYWYARSPAVMPTSGLAPEGAASAAERKILYYRDPSGAPYWSAEPKKDAQGRDYLPVSEDEEISFCYVTWNLEVVIHGLKRIVVSVESDVSDSCSGNQT